MKCDSVGSQEVGRASETGQGEGWRKEPVREAGKEELAVQEVSCAPGMERAYIRRVPDTHTQLQPCCDSPVEQASYPSACALSTVWHRACCRYHEMV